MHVGSCMIIWRDKATLSEHKLNRYPLFLSMPPIHPPTPTYDRYKETPIREGSTHFAESFQRSKVSSVLFLSPLCATFLSFSPPLPHSFVICSFFDSERTLGTIFPEQSYRPFRKEYFDNVSFYLLSFRTRFRNFVFQCWHVEIRLQYLFPQFFYE